MLSAFCCLGIVIHLLSLEASLAPSDVSQRCCWRDGHTLWKCIISFIQKTEINIPTKEKKWLKSSLPPGCSQRVKRHVLEYFRGTHQLYRLPEQMCQANEWRSKGKCPQGIPHYLAVFPFTSIGVSCQCWEICCRQKKTRPKRMKNKKNPYSDSEYLLFWVTAGAWNWRIVAVILTGLHTKK